MKMDVKVNTIITVHLLIFSTIIYYYYLLNIILINLSFAKVV